MSFSEIPHDEKAPQDVGVYRKLAMESVSKSFGNREVLRDISFEIQEGEFLVILGPSGCGKSTLLRLIAGLERAGSGRIIMDSNDMSSVPARKRNVAMVFQDYALFPHMTVFENMAYGLRVHNLAKEAVDQMVQEAAAKLKIGDRLQDMPGALSGGQRQRVAIGRAIVLSPSIFLFDEPLSNLDAALRLEMRHFLAKMHYEKRATVAYVTHDQVEALTLADKVILLENGLIQQIGSPFELYYQPRNLFVAKFIGHPPMNILPGEVTIREGGWIDFKADSGFVLRLDQDLLGEDTFQTKRRVVIGFRPEDLMLEIDDASRNLARGGATKARITTVEFTGALTTVYTEAGGLELRLSVPSLLRPKVGDIVNVRMGAAGWYVFDEKTGQCLVAGSARLGASGTLALE